MTPKQLKRARESLKLKQAEIAAELEISERYWLYRESGVKPITRWLARAVRDLQLNPDKRA
jgi:transcriptional regulator with XRE-family HTH domain